MFTTLQLRLCCLSAMAPALTEAASQAQNFKLPYTPPASAQNLSGSSIVVVNRLRLQNCRTSCVDFQQPSDPTEFFTENLMQNKGVISTLVVEGNDSDKSLLLTDNYDFDDIFLDNPKLSLFDLDFITDTEDLIEETPLKQLSCFERQKHCSFIHTMNSIKNNKNLNAMGISKTSVNLQLTAERNDKLLNIVNSSIMQHPSNNLIPCVDMYADYTGQTELDALTKYSTGENQESEVTKGTLINDRLQETYARQINLERRSERLMRRIQKLQAHQVEVHVSSQLAAFVEYQQKTLNLPSKKERMQHGLRSSNASSSSSSTSSVDIKAEILQSEKVKSLSTAALVNLVRKLESSHGSALRQKYVSFQNLRTSEKHDSSSTEIKLPKEVCSEMNRVAGTLQRDIRHLQRAIDSDATESSSGGESCDEMDGYDEKKTRLVPVYKRAKWKWSVDRAAIGSRWTWLKAQVSDLEYRIRQQNEIYRQLRATKGPVILGEGSVLEDSSESKASQNSSDLSRLGHKKLNSIETKLINLERHGDLALASILGNDAKSLLVQSVGIGVQNYSRHSTPVNGFVTSGNTGSPSCEPTLTNDSESNKLFLDSNPGSASTPGEQTSPNNDMAGFTACRVRPLQSFRKRKILRTTGINYNNRKAAKLTTVKCGCLPQVTACILCGGRLNLNYMQSLDTETMSTEERIGLLDPSFHSILSFDQDIPLAFHLEALLKSGEWQKGAQKSKPLAANRKKTARLSTQVKDVCKHSRKLKKNAAATLTAKLKKKFTEDKRPRGRGVSARMSNQEGAPERVRKRNNASHVSLALKKRERSFSGSSGSSSKPTSPIPSPVLTDHSMLQVESGVQSFSSGNFDQRDHHRKSSFSQDIMRRRRGESAFDINNIVIPYSMAAATRVERLQYKEILTPKWRLIEDAAKEKEETIANNLCKNNGLVASTEESHEDISDEAITIRHDKCEQEEKKRFMSYVHTQWNTRGRSRSIRDSRADSSGANTPDPLSPYPFEHHDSPLTTPPSTPAPCIDEGNSNLGSRRRTTSLTKRDRLFEDFRSSTPEIEEEPVLPWESRTFPLADKDYEDLVANNSHSSFTTSWEPPAPVSYDNNEPESKIDPCSRPSTPSSSSGSVGDDDPNDPEWTVASVPAEKSPRPGIVIKLAKR